MHLEQRYTSTAKLTDPFSFDTRSGFLISNINLVVSVVDIRHHTFIAIQDGCIVDIGYSHQTQPEQQLWPVIDGCGYWLIPGLVNSHTHAAMGFFRGLGHGRLNMIETYLFPAEKKLSAELIEPLSYSYLVGGLLSGTTSVFDHYYFVEGVGKALDRLGMRGWIGETVADLGGAFPGQSSWSRAVNHIQRWPHSSRIKPMLAPHAADTTSPELLKDVVSYAKNAKLPIHLHLSQTAGEKARVEKLRGVSPVSYAHRQGVLGPQTLAVHLTSVDDHDVNLLQSTGTSIGFCPASQMIFEKLAPIGKFTNANLNVVLGTDCAASNDTSDMLAEMRCTALLSRSQIELKPDQVFNMATANAGSFLSSNIGTLNIGSAADFAVLKADLSTLPVEDPVSNLVYSWTSRSVNHVMVDGAWVVWDSKLVKVSEETLTNDYVAAVAEIKKRLASS
jgi:5-methylthioadenosine/S-adenosylhomocysteine deaminase